MTGYSGEKFQLISLRISEDTWGRYFYLSPPPEIGVSKTVPGIQLRFTGYIQYIQYIQFIQCGCKTPQRE